MNRLLAYVASRSTAEDVTDSQLLRRFATEQDEPAFAELVRRHGPLVWGVCRRNLWNPADAEDAFQATFLVLLRRAERLAPSQQFGPWLYKVATWCCRNIRRGNRRRLSRVGVGISDDLPMPERDDGFFPALDSAVLSLPEKYRVPIVLCHLQGMSRQEVARYLGCPEGTLSARLSRALAKLRVKLSNGDPAALLAIGGALAAPAAVANAAVRAATIYATATGAVPQTILSTTDGVLRMFRFKKIRLAAAALVAMFGVGLIGTKLAAISHSPETQQPEKPAANQSEKPAATLAPGHWRLIRWSSAQDSDQAIQLTIKNKDDKLAITSIKDDKFEWECKNFVVENGRISFTLTRDGSINPQFNGLIDASHPNRILGSVLDLPISMERAELEFIPQAGLNKRAKPASSLWKKYIDLAAEYGRAQTLWENPEIQSLPAGKKAELRAEEEAAAKKYYAEVPEILRQLATKQPPDAFAYDAVMHLFNMLDRIKPKASEVDLLTKIAREYSIAYGPEFEAFTVGKIGCTLICSADYSAQARAYAREADKLATAAGVKLSFSELVAEYDAERAAWATLPNPPKEGSKWTVTIMGRVTDSDGNPIPGAEVSVNNLQWVNVNLGHGDGQAFSDADGKYSITLTCQGSYRVHVARMLAKKKGLFVLAEDNERHKLLPGESATINFTLKRGEQFGAMLKLRLTPEEQQTGGVQWVLVTGGGVREWIYPYQNEKKFELTLPPGEYTVEVNRPTRLTPLKWTGLKTGRTDYILEEPPFRYTPDTVGAGFDRMWTAFDYSYSYFSTKPDIDWNKLKEQYRPKAMQAKNAGELINVLKEMLAHLNDGHVWIIAPDGKQLGTHPVSWNYNGNRKVVMDQLTDTTQCGDFAIIGKTKPDGFGYFLMTRQSAATAALVKKAIAAIEKLADAPGFIVDLRNANGGNELFAQDIAALFCREKVIYAKSRYRNGKEHDVFGQDQPRWLTPAKSGKPYLKPVACLLGPGCVSSGEGFAQMMAALPHVTTIGLPTRGSSGNPAPIEVGETGISVYFSRWVDLLPDGTPIEGKGVPPTIRVEEPTSAYRDADPTLAKALELLRAKSTEKK